MPKHPSKPRSNYYPFGSTLNTRGFSAGNGFRFGFNTQEKDKEIYNNYETYTATFWEYDGRLGRRWNLDPIYKPWLTNYHAFSDNPILKIDNNGDSDGDFYTKEGKYIGNDGINDNKAYVVDNEYFDKNNNSIKNKVDWGNVKNSKNTINLTEKYGMTNTDLLNRAHWAFGEGGGQLLEYYAHAINNLS